jgi:hypothetical protein
MKILGFDSWSRGANHYNFLLPAFEAKGMSLSLIHLGSWGNDPGRPEHEEIGQLGVRDISSYGHNSLDKVLAEEKPDAVIFLWTQTFAHRAFNRFCKEKGIPTLNLYHGLITVQVVDSKGSFQVSSYGYARFVLSKLYKTLRYTLPCYIGALIRTQASMHDWARFLEDLIRMGIGRANLIASDDARTTRCCVYTQTDIEHAVLTYGFEASDVIAVGNPDLVQFGLKQEMIGRRITSLYTGNSEVMYIDTGLVTAGLFFKNREEFIEHLKHTSESLTSQGMKMLLKPHPAHDAGFLGEKLKGLNIELVMNDTFLQRLESCTACIVETTTLALLPALIGIPMLYANYGRLDGLRFGPVLMSYPRGYLLEDVSNVSNILIKDRECLDLEAVRSWITVNAGPLPAEEMPNRVADVVKELISRRRELH